jgi:hypothetical protein
MRPTPSRPRELSAPPHTDFVKIDRGRLFYHYAVEKATALGGEAVADAGIGPYVVGAVGGLDLAA